MPQRNAAGRGGRTTTSASHSWVVRGTYARWAGQRATGLVDARAEPRRIRWAKLLRRVFKVDISTCPRCQGPMRMLDAVTDPDKIALQLHGARAPPRPSPPEQLSLLAG